MSLAFESAPASFRDEVLDQARRIFPDGEPLVRGQDANEIVHGGRHIYLDNLYAVVKLLPFEEREIEVRDWLGRIGPGSFDKYDAAAKNSDDWLNAKPLLRPMLQAHVVVDRFETIIQRPFSPELVITYVIDVGDANAYVMKRKLDAWSVQVEDVHHVAIANLEAMSADMDLVPERCGHAPGSYLIFGAGDSYDASRLLLPAFRGRLLAAMGPSLRASVPDRNALFVWSPDFAYREAIRQTVRDDATKRPHALSNETFELDSNGVRLVRPRSRPEP